MTNDFDESSVRTSLILLRKKLGADTPAGCSNLLEQLENLAKNNAMDGDPFVTSDQRRRLEKDIGRSVAELSALSSSDPKGT